ncbi:MAG: hypothetical protein HBSIN02_25180 [Bacteroidia bacterium]|nr:MAG: hypothetical protein HBSIN02_25180 [Bacteroidia bacterium]
MLDTSICVDLFNAGLLESFLRLPYEFLLLDVIVDELKEPPGQHLIDLGFLLVSLEGENIGIVQSLAEEYRATSRVDLFALAYAQAHECILITGDAALRAAAVEKGIDVHGVLWVMDALVAQNIVTPADAANSLDRMMTSGSWLPREETRHRITRWRGMQ